MRSSRITWRQVGLVGVIFAMLAFFTWKSFDGEARCRQAGGRWVRSQSSKAGYCLGP